MSSTSKNLPAEPEGPPSPPPKEPPQVPPKDNDGGKSVNKYSIRLAPEGEGADAAEAAESDFSDSEESYGLLQGKEKRRPSWHWLHRSRSWIIAITISFLLACLTIKLFRHGSNSSGNGGSKNGGPFRAAKAPTPPAAKDYALNFPEQYPPLAAGTSEECKAAWGKLTSVTCHSRIWSRNWDAGKMQPLGPSLARFLPQMCREPCATELRQIAEEVGQHCWTARWDVEGYNGRFNSALLEESPAEVTRVLRDRFLHMCFESPSGDAEMGYCMTDLEQRWWIWDGMYANHMANLGSFLRFTNERKIEPKRKMSGVRGGGDWRQPYNYWREERQFGPKKGETSCSFCTIKWFLRMMEAWNARTVDENGEPIDLPYYLARVYQAGRRCTNTAPGASFQQLFDMKIESYKTRGLLDDDWEASAASKEVLPPEKAPTLLDQPLPSMRASLKKLEEMNDGMTKLHKTYANLLGNLYESTQNLSCNALITFDDLKEYLDHGVDITPLCSQTCQSSHFDVSSLLRKLSPQRIKMYDDYAEKYDLYNVAPLKDSQDLISQACHSDNSRFGHKQPCSVVFHRFGKLDWIRRSFDDPKDIAITVREALKTLPEVPPNMTDMIQKPKSDLSSEESSELAAWTKPLRNGACSLCFWRKFVQGAWFADDEPRPRVPGFNGQPRVSDETLKLWFGAAKAMFEGCADVGVRFEQREYDAIAKEIPEEMRNELIDGAEGQGRMGDSGSTEGSSMPVDQRQQYGQAQDGEDGAIGGGIDVESVDDNVDEDDSGRREENGADTANQHEEEFRDDLRRI